MPNSIQVVPSAITAVTISRASDWFTDSGLSVAAAFPASISATTTYYTSSTGSYFVQGVVHGSDRIESQVTVKASSAVVLTVPLLPSDRSGLAASRPAAATYLGQWLSEDTGSLDYSDGATWTTGIGGGGGSVNTLGTPSNPETNPAAAHSTVLTVEYWLTATRPTNLAVGDVWESTA